MSLHAYMSVVMVLDARLDSSYYQVTDQVLSSLSEFSPVDWGLPRFENASTKLDYFSLIMILKFPAAPFMSSKFRLLGFVSVVIHRILRSTYYFRY